MPKMDYGSKGSRPVNPSNTVKGTVEKNGHPDASFAKAGASVRSSNPRPANVGGSMKKSGGSMKY
jgi:hypothetical protein